MCDIVDGRGGRSMRSSSEGKTGTGARTAEQINNAGKEQATSKRARVSLRHN
jgi:hypothetical protein